MDESPQAVDGSSSGASARSSVGVERLRRAARPAELLLGLVFVVSAVLKAADVNVFIVQLSQYGVPSLYLEAATALLVIGVETGVGVLLMLGQWRRLALVLSGLMLVVFTGVIFYGWFGLGLDDCGCMGIVKMPPAVSVVKNLLLLGLWTLAWVGLVRARVPLLGSRLRRFAKSLLAAVAAIVVAYGVGAYAGARVERVQEAIMGPRPFSAYTFEADGRTWDLGKGEYFVALLSTTCSHCMKAVKPLNELKRHPGFPPVVGLCKGNDELQERFRERTHPEFPLHELGFREFWALVGMGPPRYVLVRDGQPKHIWDYTLPSVEDVERARAASGQQAERKEAGVP